MDTLQLILLSVVQGLTEFLPVSSSAHLVLLSEFLGEEDQGIIFDVGVHFGTLMAALVYFRSDLKKMIINLGSHKFLSKENNLTANLIIAVIPILLLGFLLRDFVNLNLRNSEVIAYATIIFGILLYTAQLRKGKEDLDSVNLKQALIIGLFQCLALIPGTSRSGITITAGLFLGLSATAASRFSFLLAIPTIGAIALAELIRVSFIDIMDNGVELSIALIISFLVAYISIDMFLKLIDRIGFTPFVIYRLLLGGWLLMYWT
ncbi:MAG TPA: undecaprenyl-diphosphate phosphatase [Gammaproteobacteria bacterium]|jgi:undecaprenyl-diphosphatase|nr:undecaprenyl-diphosphate phosphatase [Gammaproteobacteria bacterium]HIG49621.1 undecaprenyl-diphosphate phosphatase [Gammaproteobacteria bacterium]HIN74533.1 undecaprenyl-diphosphate phosphatase [Gammaproteobacteria bacterium]